MESFTKNSLPKLKESQHYLALAELRTGIILDLNENYNSNPDDYPVLIFDSFEEIKEFAEKKILENPDVECLIYNHKQEFVEVVFNKGQIEEQKRKLVNGGNFGNKIIVKT